MFTIDGNLKFVNVNIKYLEHLHKVCKEVFYQETKYENKPYLGLFVSDGNKKYVLPLTSAKEKHKEWKDIYPDRMLIYQIENKSEVNKNAIFTELSDSKIKHIFSAIEIKKMIPVKDCVISEVNINIKDEDTEEMKKYKNLLKNEYLFCLKNKDLILSRASKIYEKQMDTGKVLRFGCDFRKLEKAMEIFDTKKYSES
ncbi:MAG: type III toxin-antitoxin system ToxN/AbiQ family toxin [Acetatifactor sp.]|nr:type III toxin-antitoxin system ToxN/AbiQ family toxin [Acetatifactor sp.]